MNDNMAACVQKQIERDFSALRAYAIYFLGFFFIFGELLKSTDPTAYLDFTYLLIPTIVFGVLSVTCSACCIHCYVRISSLRSVSYYVMLAVFVFMATLPFVQASFWAFSKTTLD